MTPTLFENARRWIESSWHEEGSRFGADNIPVAQFDKLDVDDTSYPFKNQGTATWLLQQGALIPRPDVAIARLPYIAFALLEDKAQMLIQIQWAPRCGYGFEVSFDRAGDVVEQNMRWVS